MSIQSVFQSVEAINREIVMQDTWGHLAPIKNKSYKGFFTFASGCFGSCNPIILSFEFKELDISPWLYDWLQELIFAQNIEPGFIYRFDGLIRNYKFKGIKTVIFNTNK